MKKVVIAMSAIVMLIAAIIWGIGAYLYIDDLRSCGQAPTTSDACRSADAIVAVSGGDTLARADEAIKLYRNGWARYIVFSGAAADKSGPSNAQVMKRHAIASGVPAAAILIETMSETTEENAMNTTQILDQYHISSVILVTSVYHQRRATLEFHKSAPKIFVRSHPVESDRQWQGGGWWLTPTGWNLAIQELGKIIVSTRN